MKEIKGTEITTTYKRVTPRPLDASTLFDNYKSATEYALNVDDVNDYCPHEGQVIAVKQTGALYRLRKNPSYYTEDENGNITDNTIDGKSGHFTLVELDQCVIFFNDMLEDDTNVQSASIQLLAEPSNVYYVKTTNAFVCEKGGLSTQTYYNNWGNRIKWTDEQSLPLKEKIYASLSENILYRYDEDQTKLVPIGGTGQGCGCVVDDSLDFDSENAVQNKVIASKFETKQDKLSTVQMNAVNSGITKQDKTKLDSLVKVNVDDALDATSTNAIENKAVTTKFNSLATVNGQSILNGGDISYKKPSIAFSFSEADGCVYMEQYDLDGSVSFSINTNGDLILTT